MSHKLEIGKTYKQREALLHIIALHDGYALIENHYDGKVTQYIVTSGLYIEDNGELHWSGNGHYYLCENDAQDALKMAWWDFMGDECVFVLTVDTEEQNRPYVYGRYELALAALQRELDKNQSIQEIAGECGLLPLTAQAYLEHTALFGELMMDTYTIASMPVITREERR